MKINFIKKIKLSIILFTTINSIIISQPDLLRFNDSAHHWYDINDEEKKIEPLINKPKYNSSEFVKIADNILLFQKSNGGWTKNYDVRAILNLEQKEKILADKNNLNTTFDNGATHSHLSYLAEVYTLTKDDKYKDAFLKGLNFILGAQYDNGGFPQYFPDTSGYRKYITFNDGAMTGVMRLLIRIIQKDKNYLFVPEEYFTNSKIAFEMGIECILNSQIVENGNISVWCQQHDNVNLLPQNARSFEPVAICNLESADIVLLLMEIENPNEKIKTAIKNAVNWFEKSAINGIRVETFKSSKEEFIYHKTEFDRKVIEDKSAPRIWTRYYDLKTHQPIFCRRDGKIVQSLEEVDRERRTGYVWYTYGPEKVLQLYPNWMEKKYK